jgi:very-short-patch-repair endonuclease
VKLNDLRLLHQVQALKLPEPIPELRFSMPRRWRFDLAWPEHLLAVEIDGGGYVNGRHSRGKGMDNDCEKFAIAMIMGWRVLRVTPTHVQNGQAIQWIQSLLTPVRQKAVR